MFTKKNAPFVFVAVVLMLLVTLFVYRCICGSKDLKEKMTQETLVFFYADWCGYCKQFKPEVQKYKGMSVQHVDCTQPGEKEKQLMQQYNVTGFPALFYKSTDKQITFNKPRTTSGIVEFVNECRSK